MEWWRYIGLVLQVLLVFLPHVCVLYLGLYDALSEDAWYDKLMNQYGVNSVGPQLYVSTVGHFCTMSLVIGLAYQKIKWKLHTRVKRGCNWRWMCKLNAVAVLYVGNVAASLGFVMVLLETEDSFLPVVLLSVIGLVLSMALVFMYCVIDGLVAVLSICQVFYNITGMYIVLKMAKNFHSSEHIDDTPDG